MPPIFFDTEYYLNAKLAQTQRAGETDPSGKPYTLATLEKAITDAGMTPEQHYALYGRGENLNANAYFNEAEYLAAKLEALQGNADTKAQWADKSTADLAKVMAEHGMNPAEHYERYGAFETKADGTVLNPSNAFDANAYYAAKLQQMILKGENLNGKDPSTLTVAEVVKAVQDAGMSAVSHFLQYGAAEANQQNVPLVQTVPQSQRVPNDPQRPASETVPPNYNQPSKGPDSSKPQAVTKPADVGGYTDTDVSPPVVPPAKPAPVPGDKGYVAPPPGLVDDGVNTIFPPTGSEGTGPNAGWVVVNPDTGEGQVIGSDGSVKGDISLPTEGGSVAPPKPDTPVYGPDGENINTKPVDDNGKPVPLPNPEPPKVPLAVAKADPGTLVKITGDTDENSAAKIELSAADELGITGKADKVAVLAGDTIDATAVVGGSILRLDVRGGSHDDLIIKGATATATEISIKAAAKVQGGNLNDKLVIEGDGISEELSLGTGTNTVSLGTGGKLDMGKVKLSANENFHMQVGAGGTGTGYSGTLIVDENATVGFDAKGIGASSDTLVVGAGVTLGLDGGKFAGEIETVGASAQTLHVLADTTLRNLTLGAGGDSVSISGGKKLTLLKDMDKDEELGTLTVDTFSTLTLSRSGTGTGTLNGNVVIKGAIDGSATTLQVEDGITIAGSISGDIKEDVVQVLGNATVSGGMTLGLNSDGYGNKSSDRVLIAHGKTLTLDKAFTVIDGGFVHLLLPSKVTGSATLKGNVEMLSSVSAPLPEGGPATTGPGSGTEFRVGTAATSETVAGDITIIGNISGGAGEDTMTNQGNTTVQGTINLGGGTNALSIWGGKVLDLTKGVVNVEAGSTLYIKDANTPVGLSKGTFKGNVVMLTETGETAKILLDGLTRMEGKINGGAGDDEVVLAGAFAGSVRLGEGTDILDLNNYSAPDKMNVIMGLGEGTDYVTNGVLPKVEIIKVGVPGETPLNPKAFTVQVDGYKGPGAWTGGLQIKSNDNSLAMLDAEIAAGTVNNKAYLVQGSYNEGKLNPNTGGVDWLLVYDADVSGAIKMETVLLSGLGAAGYDMYATSTGIFDFHP